MGADGTELTVLIGVGRSGVDRIQPRRLLLAVDAGTVTAVPGTGSYRQGPIDSRCMQDSANDRLSKHPGGGEQL
jgi:hypothetical protein